MRLEIYRTESGEYGWRRRADNNEITATGESSRRKWNAKRGARRQFPNDPVVDLTRATRRAGGL